MTEFVPGELPELLGRLRQRTERMAEVQHSIAELTATATAPRHALSVTVGGQGEVRDLSFPTDAYRSMAPAELAALIKKTIDKARLEVAQEMDRLLSGFLPEGFSMTEVAKGRPDWTKFAPVDVASDVERWWRTATGGPDNVG
jgi:DNA-binding protein YbaB